MFKKKRHGFTAHDTTVSGAGDTRRKNEVKRFCEEEEGIGVVEVILILVVIIGLIIIFKSQLTSLINDTFDNITDQAGTL